MGRPEGSKITIALAGQPNVGKSTVFNMLTGLNQHVGNWPGKTVEQKSGEFVHGAATIHLVDLPGTYSLTANSDEERIARDFILRERPDAVIAIVNAAALERGLYLVAELLMLPAPLIVGLNMIDVAEAQGTRIDVAVLEAALGLPVVGLVATKNRGVRDLVDAVMRLLDEPSAAAAERPALAREHQPQVERLRALVAGRLPEHYPDEWVALKLLEGDVEVAGLVRNAAPDVWNDVEDVLMRHEDAYLEIATSRYSWVERMVRAAVARPRAGVITRTDQIDRLATHHVWGPLALLLLLGLVFWLTYTVAGPLVQWLDQLVTGPLTSASERALAGAPAWLSGLVVDGLVAGVGTVLTFVPILVMFFASLGVLEDVGYLARAAYVMDPFMHRMGLHGKSVLPLAVGFGCNVPAVMGARIIEDRRARLLTILLAPLIPCTARLAVLTFLAPAFFGSMATLASLALVGTNLLLLFAVGISVNRGVFHGNRSAFIMELPLYHRPNPRTIGLFVWRSTLGFLKKAGSLIVVISMVIWALSSFPGDDIQQSFLADIGRFLAPIGALVGLEDWRLIVALLSSFAAKENTIATLGILFPPDATGADLAERVALVLVPAAAAAFLVVQMTFIPCAAVLATIRQETASWRWTAASVALMLALALAAGTLVYQIGSRL
jgi:ferrous iron transport protein B